MIVSSALSSLLVGALVYAAAAFAEKRGIGLLYVLSPPRWAAVAITLLILDLAVYFQHVLFHAVPAFWRFHAVHHADVDFDTTTGLRFHPIEIVVSGVWKAVVAVALGAVPFGIIAFESLLNGFSLFNHANVRIPGRLEKWIRWLIVTPEMHRVHHSIREDETDSNFSSSVSWWDRLFGTYRAAPALGQLGMEIGLRELRSPLRFGSLLGLPFAGALDRPSLAEGLRVSRERLRVELAPPPPPLVLDVRSAEEYEGDLGHIVDSVLIPLPELERRIEELAAHRGHRIVTV